MRNHRDEVEERIAELERNPLFVPVAADHTDELPDPDPVNGHVPDYRAEGIFGQDIIGEVEHMGDDSQHTRNQLEAFGEEAAGSPDLGLEVTVFDEDGDDDIFSLF